MKNQNISDFVAATMNAVLNSDEHQSLFGSAYKTAAKKCAKCTKDKDDCMCGDSSMLDDSMGLSGDDVNPRQKEAEQRQKEAEESAKPLQEYVKDLLSYFIFKHQGALRVGSFASEADVKKQLGANSFDMVQAVKRLLKSMSGKSLTDFLSNEEMVSLIVKERRADSGAAAMPKAAALDVAVESLLTASAALDALNMDYGSALSLKLASLVSEAKKKMSPAAKKELLERLQKGKKDSGKSSESSKSSASSKSSTDSQKAKDKKMSGSSSSKSSDSAPKKK